MQTNSGRVHMTAIVIEDYVRSGAERRQNDLYTFWEGLLPSTATRSCPRKLLSLSKNCAGKFGKIFRFLHRSRCHRLFVESPARQVRERSHILVILRIWITLHHFGVQLFRSLFALLCRAVMHPSTRCATSSRARVTNTCSLTWELNITKRFRIPEGAPLKAVFRSSTEAALAAKMRVAQTCVLIFFT